MRFENPPRLSREQATADLRSANSHKRIDALLSLARFPDPPYPAWFSACLDPSFLPDSLPLSSDSAYLTALAFFGIPALVAT
jgi:hypothetical protein